MRWFILAGLLSVALAGCRPPAGGAVDGLPPEVTADAQLSIPDLRKRIDQYRAAAATATARADALDRILSVKEQAALQTKARWAGAGFLALAVLLLVVSFYLGVARKTLLTAAVCLGLLGGGCLVFAWLVPYLLPIGIGLAVLLALVGAYLVRADKADRDEAFKITAAVAQKLGAGAEAAQRKALLFTEELASAKRLDRAKLKAMRDKALSHD